MNASKGMAATARGAWNLLLDLLYPPRCGGCDRRGMLFCEGCRSRITPAPHRSLPGIHSVVSAGAFAGPLREAIHKLKYEGDASLARPLAALLSERLSEDASWVQEEGEPPVLVPVPLYSSRLRRRGFNQSELIARELARRTGWSLSTGLVRLRDTLSQVGLGAEERADNMRGAFEWRGAPPPGWVMLIDDVCTTGATLRECAAALKAAGVRRVVCVTVATAEGTGHDGPASGRVWRGL